jgi:protein translocase SecG subunit
VLIQKPQGGGLAGAFGAGASSGQTAFGTKTGDALTVFTIIMFSVFVLLAVVMNYASQSLVRGPGPAATEPAGEAPANGSQPAGAAAPTTTPGTTPASTPAPTPATTPGATPGTAPAPAGEAAPAPTPGSTPAGATPPAAPSGEPAPAPATAPKR